MRARLVAEFREILQVAPGEVASPRKAIEKEFMRGSDSPSWATDLARLKHPGAVLATLLESKYPQPMKGLSKTGQV